MEKECEGKEVPLSPSFPMEKEENTKEYIHNLVTPIFDKVLKEGISKGNMPDTMGVSDYDKKHNEKLITFYWRPNNYRLQIPFNKEKINIKIPNEHTPIKKKGCVIKTKEGNIKISNFGSKISCEIDGFPIMLDKNFIAVTYSLKMEVFDKKFNKKIKKGIYKIEANNLKEIQDRINERVEEIKNKCIEKVKKFISLYGGEAEFGKEKFILHEDSIHKEDWMPKEEIIYDTHFKKVYPNEIELKSPLLVKNYISNRVIEEIAPQIAKEIKDSNNSIDELKDTIVGVLNPVLKDFTAQMRLHLEVQTETKETLKEIRKPFFIRWYNYFKHEKKVL